MGHDPVPNRVCLGQRLASRTCFRLAEQAGHRGESSRRRVSDPGGPDRATSWSAGQRARDDGWSRGGSSVPACLPPSVLGASGPEPAGLPPQSLFRPALVTSAPEQARGPVRSRPDPWNQILTPPLPSGPAHDYTLSELTSLGELRFLRPVRHIDSIIA